VGKYRSDNVFLSSSYKHYIQQLLVSLCLWFIHMQPVIFNLGFTTFRGVVNHFWKIKKV